MHRLLERQLRKYFAGRLPDGEEFAAFLRAVDEAYAAADEDRAQLERSLHLASEELFERNLRLESELEERKRLELELRLAEKLRAVGQLAAGVAHEINTPVQFIGDSLHFLRDAFADLAQLQQAHDALLTASLGAAERETLERRIAELSQQLDVGYLRAEIPQAIARCAQGTERVTKIVRALKELAHPDTANQQLADINAAIQNTLIVVANEIKYVADVELALQSQQHVLCHIGEIQQVLLNLIVNAGHAVAERIADSGAKGRIRISTRDDGVYFIILIEDDGVGIPPSLHDRIFEPFFTTKPMGKGSGQGLPIARSLIVERHGGQLGFESTVGKGTTFTIRLPIAGRLNTAAPAAVQQLGGLAATRGV